MRKLRKIFEDADTQFQYVLLCEPNHIIMKNFKSIYPKDMILVQMNNYEEKIQQEQNGKPLRLVPYVTFLPKHIDQLFSYINDQFSNRENEVFKTSCMWVDSPISPVKEIDQMSDQDLSEIKDALLITSPGSTNKSIISLEETIESKGLNVVRISSLNEYIRYEKRNRSNKVLLVRSPIPNKAEKPIVTYIKNGILVSYCEMIADYVKLRTRKYLLRLQKFTK